MSLSDLTQLVPVEFARSRTAFAVLGLITHHLFHRYEWDFEAHKLLIIWPVVLASTGAVEWVHSKSIYTVLETTVTAVVVYFTTLLTSILIHRVFFHRLRKVCSCCGQSRMTRLKCNSSRVPFLRVFPSFNQFSQAYCLRTYSFSDTAKYYTRNTRPMSSELVQES